MVCKFTLLKLPHRYVPNRLYDRPAIRKRLAEFRLSMADYYPVIVRSVADVEPNPAARSEFYWLARTELEVQLCSCNPPLTPSEMRRERLALDEAIRRFEKECASPVVKSVRMPTPEGQRRKLSPELRLRPEMHVSTEVRQQQARSRPTLEPASIGLRPLTRLAGVLLVIG